MVKRLYKGNSKLTKKWDFYLYSIENFESESYGYRCQKTNLSARSPPVVMLLLPVVVT